MAIGIAAKALAKKLLKNKSLKKAINVTTKQTSKLKEAVKVNTKKVAGTSAASAATATKNIAKKTVSKGKELGKKAVKKTVEGAKKASTVTAGTATGAAVTAGKKAKDAISKKIPDGVKETARKAGVKAKDVGNKIRSDVDIGATIAGRKAKAGVAGAMGIGKKATEAGKQFAKKDPFIAGMAAQGAIDIPLTVGAVALTASMIKSSTPKEAEYNIRKLPDGRFTTTFKDANANSFFSNKQLSAKETDEVRSLIAILDSIIISNDPSKRRKEFLETAQLLGGKYGISNISGKNLSIMMPTVAGNTRTL